MLKKFVDHILYIIEMKVNLIFERNISKKYINIVQVFIYKIFCSRNISQI